MKNAYQYQRFTTPSGAWILLGLAMIGSSSSVFAQAAEETGTEPRRVYTAQLTPLNPSVSAAKASVRIIVEGNRAGIYIEGSGFTPNTIHLQHIHLGSSCPTQTADKNGDGFVDAIEAHRVTGPAVVPLSLNPVRSIIEGITTPPTGTTQDHLGNIASQSSYPASSYDGQFTYIASIPIQALDRALTQGVRMMPVPEPTPSPSSPREHTRVNLEKKVIMIHGLGTQTPLPNTVQSIPNLTPAQSLPIACGQITEAIESPHS